MPTFGPLLFLVALVAQSGTAELQSVDAFRLQDFRGASFSLDDVRDRKLVVLAFLGVDCPLANRLGVVARR